MIYLHRIKRVITYLFLFALTIGPSTYAHSGYWGVAAATDTVFTNKGLGAQSLQGLLLLAWIDLGFEANAIINPQNYNSPQQNAFNGIIGFNLYGVFYVNYISSKHWQVALNVPVSLLFKSEKEKSNQPMKIIGLLLAVDFPNVAEVEHRYRIGISFAFLDGPGIR